MRKQEFLDLLEKGLTGLPQSDRKERLAFYSEMIDDRIEEGAREEDVIAELGPAEELAASIIAETPLTRLVKERITPKRSLGAWEIVLLVLGAPLWLPLLIAAFAVILSLYAVLWSLIAALWTVFAAVLLCAPACVAGCIVLLCRGETCMGLALLGAGFVCAGISVLLFFGCKAATKGVAALTKLIAAGIKNSVVKKEADR